MRQDAADTDDVDKPRVGIGTCEIVDSAEAGRRAAQAAVDRLGGEPPALVVVYTSTRYDLTALLAGVRGVTGEAPLIGATTSGQLHEGILVPPGTGVGVLALTAGGYQFGVASATGVMRDPFEAGRDLARNARAAVGPDPAPHAALLLLADGLAWGHQTVLNGIYRVAGAAVPVVGGSAGDDRKLVKTFVFHNDKIMDDAVVGVWIGAERPITVAYAHGWRPSGMPLMVTKVDGPVIHEIAGRAALEVYRENFQSVQPRPSGWGLDDSFEYNPTHALGLVEPDGSQIIRATLVSDNELRTFAPLPAYAAIQVVSCEPDDLLDVVDQVVHTAVGDHSPAVILAFSCIARMDILGDRAKEEPARLDAAAGGVPTFGFYTYGEFARTTSVAGYHNATLTAVAL